MDHLPLLVARSLSPVDLADLLDLNIYQREVGRRTGLHMREKNVGLRSGNASEYQRNKSPEGVLSQEAKEGRGVPLAYVVLQKRTC